MNNDSKNHSNKNDEFVLQSKHLSWVVLVFGFLLTSIVSWYEYNREKDLEEKKFNSHCDEIIGKINERFNDYGRALVSGTALFAVQKKVTREEWNVFINYRHLEKDLPGFQGIGYSEYITPAEVKQHTLKIQKQGFPNYRIRPEGLRDAYTSIIYLEPFKERNLRAFGFDMFSEAVRRKAMELARDTGSITLSGKVHLVQETDRDIQAGILIYSPVYKKGLPIGNIKERHQAISGWVYSPYRMTDLINGIFPRKAELENIYQTHLKIYDDKKLDHENLLFECHPEDENNRWPAIIFTKTIPLKINGHTWTIVLTQTDSKDFVIKQRIVWITLTAGFCISLLLFALVRSLSNSRAEVYRQAEKLTKELSESERKFRTLFESSIDGIYLLSSKGKIILVNESFALMHGYSVMDLFLKDIREILGPANKKITPEFFQKMAIGETIMAEVEDKCMDGHIVTLEVSLIAIEYNNEKHILAIHRDVSEFKEQQILLAETERVGHVGGWEFNIDSKKQKWTDEVYNIHEVDTTFEPTVENGINFYTENSRKLVKKISSNGN
jgi:PAS domain S-box-containing protein